MSLPVKQSSKLVDVDNWHHNYGDLLMKIALNKVSDYHIAQDLVQDTFMAAWKGLKNFRGDCSEKTFLCGVLKNKIIDFYRAKGRRPTVIASQIESNSKSDDEIGDFFSNCADLSDQTDPSTVANRSDFKESLEEAVEKLPTKLRRVARLRMIEDRSTDEVTKELGISESCLWVSVHRAKKLLRATLQANWDADSLAA